MNQIVLSLFRHYRDTVPTDITLPDIVKLIASNVALRDRTEKHRHYRNTGQKQAAENEKRSCPCFSVAVRFQGGKAERHIAARTSLSQADFDHVPPERMEEAFRLVTGDPHTLLAYRTVSGCGIRVLFAFQGAKHYRTAFRTGNEYYSRLLDLPFDEKCKNETRLSGLAHDAGVCFHPDCTPFDCSAEGLLQAAVKAIERQLCDEGVEYGSGHHNEYIMRMGYLLNAYGVSQATATAYACSRFTDYEGDVAGILRSCYGKTEEHATRKLPRSVGGRERSEQWATIGEVEEFLSSQVRLRYNTVRHRCEVAPLQESEGGWRPITDRDENSLWCRMCKQGRRVRLTDLCSVIHSEYVPAFNPFVEYFKSLPPWDGVSDHIGRLASSVHVRGDQELFERHFRKWLVGIVPALLEEQVVNHEIMVFIGQQGNYKSTFFARLLPPELQEYFYTKTNNQRLTKDDLFTLSEFALICLEEIDEMRPAELNQLKAMVTLKSIDERASYGRNKEHRKHIASFCATGNNPRFLTDPTGNRRWLAAEVLSIDDPNLHPFDYTGIYSQAYALWRSGFRYWFDREETEELNAHNASFEAPNLEQELILTYYRPPVEGEHPIFVSTAQILETINRGLKQPLSAIRIGLMMRRLGFEAVRKGSKQRGYLVIEYTGDEIYLNKRATAFCEKDD